MRLPGIAARNISLVSSLLFLFPGVSTASDEETPPPCDLPESADEHMQYEVSYARIPIGTVDVYSSDASEACGLVVMETFPNIGAIRGYTEYFGLLADDGYVHESHFWQDAGDHWKYGHLDRDPKSNRIRLVEYTADSRFGALSDRTEIDNSRYASAVHDATSLIRAVRDEVSSDDSTSGEWNRNYPLYHEGSRETVPVTLKEGKETVSVEAFDRRREVLNAEIDLDFEGVHGLRDALKARFTADAQAVPVYVEARIVIGRVRLELTDYEDG